MKRDGRHEVNMLEAAQAFFTRYVPQSDCLIHRRRQDKIILKDMKEFISEIEMSVVF